MILLRRWPSPALRSPAGRRNCARTSASANWPASSSSKASRDQNGPIGQDVGQSRPAVHAVQRLGERWKLAAAQHVGADPFRQLRAASAAPAPRRAAASRAQAPRSADRPDRSGEFGKGRPRPPRGRDARSAECRRTSAACRRRSASRRPAAASRHSRAWRGNNVSTTSPVSSLA